MEHTPRSAFYDSGTNQYGPGLISQPRRHHCTSKTPETDDYRLLKSAPESRELI